MLVNYTTITLDTGFSVDILSGKTVSVEGNAGKTGGERTHKLTVSEMPSHTHTAYVYNKNKTGYESGGTASISGIENATTSSTGGSQAHNNMPPYITMNYIIYAGV